MDCRTNTRTSLLAGLALGVFLSTTAGAEEKVVATVNGEPITEEEVKEYRSARPDSAQVADQDALIEELVTREVVLQEAMRQNLEEDPQVQQELEQLRTRVLVSAAVQKALEKNPVTEEELRAEYDQLKEQMVATEYKARHILVEDEAKAKELIEQLDEGANFAQLAREHSTGPTGEKGGDLGWFNPQQMVPPFAEAVQQLEKGAYTKEPVQTQFGWHVIKLEDSRQSEPPSFEQVKGRLEQVVQQRRIGEYVQELKDEADISIKE